MGWYGIRKEEDELEEGEDPAKWNNQYTKQGSFPPIYELGEVYYDLIEKYETVDKIPEDELPTKEDMCKAFPDVKHGFEDVRVIRATLRDRRARNLKPMTSEKAKKAQAKGAETKRRNREKRLELRMKYEVMSEVLGGSSGSAPKAEDVMRMMMVEAIENGDNEVAVDIASKLLRHETPVLAAIENKSTVTFDTKLATDDELDLYMQGTLTAEEVALAITNRKSK